MAWSTALPYQPTARVARQHDTAAFPPHQKAATERETAAVGRESFQNGNNAAGAYDRDFDSPVWFKNVLGRRMGVFHTDGVQFLAEFFDLTVWGTRGAA